MEVNCPKCDNFFKVEPGLTEEDDVFQDLEEKCPKCNAWILYSIEFFPKIYDVREYKLK